MRRSQFYRVHIRANYDGEEENTTELASATSHEELAKEILHRVNSRRIGRGAENGSGSYQADPIDVEIWDASRHGAWGD